ncbi:MAG: sporulation membrane protein YtaF [Firmicutes bacterium]|nr:sporulation membrane protein YtaF [Bacillota bacterium]
MVGGEAKVSWALPVLLALAVSIDGFTVGFSCGLRRLVIPVTSLAAISLLSAAAVACSMIAGSGAAQLLPLASISAFGGVLLVILGLYIIGHHLAGLQHGSRGEQEFPDTAAAQKRSPSLTSLLQRPEKADLDRSGTLSVKEALLLGSALAADAFAAGFGAALIGMPFLPTVFTVGLTKFVLLPLGAACGRIALREVNLPHTPLWGGAILIIIGIINLFQI